MTANPKREPFGQNTKHGLSAETARLLGLSLLQKGDWDRAAAQFRLVVALAPEDTATYNNLGIALRNLGKREAAVRAFEAAIERRPDYLSAHYNLGTTLGELGRSKQALDQFAAIVRLAPEHVDARFALGEMLIETGDQASAARHLSIYLSLDPTDRFGAAMRLARIGLAPSPSRASAGQIERLYAKKAATWDDMPGYFACNHVGDRLQQIIANPLASILDLGCGTGLLGMRLREQTDQLDGVDISQPMLARAAAKRCYDTLFEGDLLEFLLHSGARYQAIASAGTLIHFGDLLPVLKAVRNALAEEALFVCSLYSYDPTDPGGFGLPHHPSLADAGCFAHGSEYVKSTAERVGLRLLSCLPVTHEENADEKIPGLLVTAERHLGS